MGRKISAQATSQAKKTKAKKASKSKKKATSSKSRVAPKTRQKKQKKNQQKKRPSSSLGLSKDLCLKIHDAMVLSRKLEERLIQVYKKGEAYFWIGAPGEEAFGVSLGLQVHKGQGINYDYLHLHYRGTPTLVAMGMDVRDSLRLIMNKATDRSTGGRNFSNHYCFPEWNVLPVTSPIEVQYSVAIGTGIAQRRKSKKGVTIVTGGDAGTAESDFASSLIWATRPGFELPMYLTVQNNNWGISTAYDEQHGEERISDRGKAFGMRTGTYNGNDPIEAYRVIQEDLEYIRKHRKPVLTEFYVSRLFGHSSASGANRIEGEECCIQSFEERLLKAGHLTTKKVNEIHKNYEELLRKAAEEVRSEPAPVKDSLWDKVYVDDENADWRKF